MSTFPPPTPLSAALAAVVLALASASGRCADPGTIAPPGPGLPSAAAPLNVTLSAAVLLLTPGSGTVPVADSLQTCHSVRELVTRLGGPSVPVAVPAKPSKSTAQDKGAVRTLCYARRELFASPGARTSFRADELRPAFAAADVPGEGIRPLPYGLVLSVSVQSLALSPTREGASSGKRGVLLTWEGQYSWSQELLTKWEKYAYALYTAAAAIPGVTYTSQTEDEDGFVNSTEGINLKSLFGRKKKKSASGAVSATAAAGKPPEPAESEPSYLADKVRQEVPLRGSGVIPDGQLLVLDFPVASADGTRRVLYLVFEAALAD